jgi:beta-glucanase (GH16 family)
MKITSTLLVWLMLLLCGKLNAQFLLLDDMEGNGPCSGKWTFYAGGANATGSVLFNVPNPAPSTVNPSSTVAKFTKDTSCFEYMSASCGVTQTFDLSTNSVFKMLVYSNVKEEIMFKLQPGNDYTKAVFFTYKVTNINQWEVATFNFQSVSARTDFNRIAVQFIDGKKANGILYFDLVQAPNPIGITLTGASIPMGQEHGTVLTARLNSAVFKPVLTTANWAGLNLPPGVHIDSVHRLDDTTATITLAGNSPANYSRTRLQLTVSGQEVTGANTPVYTAKGNVVFEGNPNWTLVYGDEFNTGSIPDHSKWTVDPKPKGWINGEQQVYTDTTRDNIRIRNGNLVITGKKDFPNGTTTEPRSSGRLISQGKMDFVYGKVEVRARLPKARGSWPAIWLMPTSSAYGGWPKSGELDIMEHVGNNLGNVLSTIHTQNSNWTNGGHLTGSKKIPDAHTTFHVYTMEWTPDSIRFVYDSTKIYTYINPHTDWKDWPFDQQFHVILNLAIGGGMGGSITEADWPDSLLVDYVHIYQKGLGTPYLDSVLVTPAKASFLPGKTQQYTVKAFDQNGHIMPVTPVWSISGTGNSITTGGLATINTTGIVSATATVDTFVVTGRADAYVRPVNYKPIPAKIQAESFDNSNTCCTETTSDIGGGVDVSYIGGSSWMEYDLNVPQAGNYRIQFRVAVNTASSLRILKDSVQLTNVNLPVSGGWQKWITVNSAPFHLTAGQQTIRIAANTSGWNFNWINVLRADSVIPSRVAVVPDSINILARSTQQFKAAVYDQHNDFIDAPIDWKVSGPPGNIISANGFFTAGDTAGTFTVKACSGNLHGKAKVVIRPLPVLTRIMLSPDTVIVPVGASQQFTVKGYDQLDSAMAFTPVWSVTGPGNAISSTGILTAGSTPGTYSVSVAGGSLSKSAVVTVDYTCTVNNKYEAESFYVRAPGPWLQTCTDVGGGQNFTGLRVNDYFSYNTLVVPVAGVYTVSVRVSTTAPATIGIGHGGVIFGTIDVPSTGGAWQTIKDTMTLPALSYTGVRVLAGTFRFNWFSIDNCAAAPAPLMGNTVSYTDHRYVEQVSSATKTILYPNPSGGPVRILFGKHSYHTMTVLSANGTAIRQWKVAAGDTQISKDLGFLERGTYYIRLEGAGMPTVLKFIRQ